MEIVSNEGNHFTSFSSAKQFMLENNKYNEDDLDRLQSLVKEKTGEIRMTGTENWEFAEFLPKGWKIKRSKDSSRKSFRSPSGCISKGLKFTLQKLIKEGYTEKEKDAFKTFMETCGWKREGLPKGWISYIIETKSETRGVNRNMDFITREGEYLSKSYKQVYEFMENNNYSEEEIGLMKAHAAKSAENRRSTFQDWISAPYLPEDWKVRMYKGKVERIFFLLPSGEYVVGLKQAYQELIKHNCPLEMKQRFMEFMETLGWSRESVPSGWIFKQLYSPPRMK